MHLVLVVVARVHAVRGLHAAVHHAGVTERVGRRHPLLLLPPVAEPHPHHLLLELQRVRQRRDLLRRRLGLLVEVLLQRALHRHLDARPLLPLAALRRDLVYARGRTRRTVRLLEPLLKQGFEFAHVFEAKLQRFEPADGCLRKHIAIERPER